MKFIFFIFVSLFLRLPNSVSAQNAVHTDLVINVNGMVCDFCAQAIWKVFEEYEAVDSIDVDLDSASVTVHLKPGQDLNKAQIDKAITYAGYDFVSLERVQHAIN